jgi:hypothetical protein
MNNRASLFASLLFVLAAAACSGKTLDGGSAATDGGAPPADGIPTTPVAGMVGGTAFTPKAIDVAHEGGRWFFTLRSYASDCGRSAGSPLTGADLKVITIADIANRAGTETIEYADGHGATFQIGVYEAGKGEAITHPVTSGTLRFDTWSETPGDTITGAVKLTGDGGSDVAGTFTAKVCPPRG